MELYRMPQVANLIKVYLEIGKTKTFAGALDWPGWSRPGRDDASSLQALFDYAPRYAHVLRGTQLHFNPPDQTSDFLVVERLVGNSTTDFGAPGVAPSQDAGSVDAAELNRFEELLEACWQAFDAIVEAATGRELRKGPRGGGRDLADIVRHVQEAEAAYLSSLGGKWKPDANADSSLSWAQLRQAILRMLASAVRGEIPTRGPRGGLRWTPRYFVRRLAWHALDHAWEIEDRVI
jgi:hypothetical protein